ncbi:MAG: hypothetical protein IPM16_12590 [Chloroflexi bacterium]|nr:hypothetical protein [Chloroflexota bacterium]
MSANARGGAVSVASASTAICTMPTRICSSATYSGTSISSSAPASAHRSVRWRWNAIVCRRDQRIAGVGG